MKSTTGRGGLQLPVCAVIQPALVAAATGSSEEFMPPLNEGDLMFMPVTDPAISLSQAIAIT